MALKTLLVQFSTDRKIDGETRRVKFKAGSVVDLTADEMELLDKLTKATGKAHYRDPKNESSAAESAPEVVDVPDYAGQDTPITQKSADQLKAYLDFFAISYKSSDTKPTLLKLAQEHEAGQGDNKATGEGEDPDSGL